MQDLSVIVPVRNAEAMIEACLTSIKESNPREIIVVDGLSRDRTVEIARRFGAKVLSDEGQGVAMARTLGVRAAESPYLALVDVDIVFPPGALADLFEEFQAGSYNVLQAGLRSEAGKGYWGQALVAHHNNGRSKNWPGVMCTIFDRATLLEVGFDHSFKSGEDIEIRWRLQEAKKKLGVSQKTIVAHRYEDTWDFARDQWTADGRGLARMVHKYGLRAIHLAGIPLAGGVRGGLLSLVKGQPRWIPYYVCYLLYNYGAMFSQFGDHLREGRTPPRGPAQANMAG